MSEHNNEDECEEKYKRCFEQCRRWYENDPEKMWFCIFVNCTFEECVEDESYDDYDEEYDDFDELDFD